MDTSSELAAPLPSSPASLMPPPTPSDQPRGGPGSVMVSEIDLSSPLNYGTPSSVGSSLRTPRTGSKGTPIRYSILYDFNPVSIPNLTEFVLISSLTSESVK